MTIEYLVRIKSNYKLNLIDKNGDKIISSSNEKDYEVHFLRFEGLYPNFEFTPSTMMSKMRDFDILDWTITDVDDFLKGNPHI